MQRVHYLALLALASAAALGIFVATEKRRPAPSGYRPPHVTINSWESGGAVQTRIYADGELVGSGEARFGPRPASGPVQTELIRRDGSSR